MNSDSELKIYISLKRWTLFSASVYFGVDLICLMLGFNLVDDYLNEVLMLIVGFVCFLTWQLLIVASLIYPLFQLRMLKWLSLLPLLCNAATFVLFVGISTWNISGRLEFMIKRRGFEQVAHYLEENPQPYQGSLSLTQNYQYLTRSAGQSSEVFIDRRNGILRVYFPMSEGFDDESGILYCSSLDLPDTYLISGGRMNLTNISKVCDHWFFCSLD